MLQRTNNPALCQNVIVGPLNNSGTNQFHNHMIGKTKSKPSNNEATIVPKATAKKSDVFVKNLLIIYFVLKLFFTFHNHTNTLNNSVS